MAKITRPSDNPEKLLALVDRWVEKIYPNREAFLERLRRGGKLVIYLGFDPTSPHLHFGHAVPLFALREFQRAGHRVILLLGDFTARIGDPTDKLSPRQPLSAAQVRANLRTYRVQAGKILKLTGPNAARLERNSKWLEKMSFTDVTRLAQNVTVQQMIERDMFQERLKAGKPIGLHEFLYPLMQGYDSVAMRVDLEICGNDQTFNALMGRTLVRLLQHREKFVATLRLLVDPKSGKKVSKTEGGLINLDDSSQDIVGKVMALGDAPMFEFAKLSTDMSLLRIAELQEGVNAGTLNPRDAKLEIAQYAAAIIHGEKKAGRAAQNFLRTFSEGVPEDIPDLRLATGSMSAADLVFTSGTVKSKAEAWRLVAQGALEVAGENIRDPRAALSLQTGQIVKIGKRRFFKIKTRK
ncbi:MAG: tyrosine--tRNA ligase [Candidatus Liptonbacteria bacterium]|nr:tyrosine--tRNA ligase [Candidatus Liptonbacteria bacterium]